MVATEFTLNTGAKIPAIGFGTWQAAPGVVKDSVFEALKAGYRHIDCAFGYGNEAEVGEGMKKAFDAGIVKREDIFVTTKLWSTWHSRVPEALEKSLTALGLDYVDQYTLHWPVPLNPNGNHPAIPTLPDGTRDVQKDWDYIKTWKALEALPESKVRALGISNQSIAYITNLLKHATKIPVCNQVENHPFLPQDELIAFCKSKGILVTAYSPLGSTGAPLMSEEKVKKVAEKRGVSVANVLINYHVNRGVCVLAKSVTPERIAANLKYVDLDEEDLETLASISKEQGLKRLIHPPWPLDLKFEDGTWDQKGLPVPF